MTITQRLLCQRTAPLIVAYGAGRDSTALLVGLWLLGIRPDLIIFADVGAERQATYDFITTMNRWLASVGFPQITVVKYVAKDFKHWPPYYTLEHNVLTNFTLPSIAYGFHSCSAKWKITPCNEFIEGWEPAVKHWATGGKCIKAVGFDASPHELKRAKKCGTYAIKSEELDRYDIWFPLQDWGWDLTECKLQIVMAGLPVPPKSSCYFCTAMKPWELEEMAETEPDKLCRIIVIEKRAEARNLSYAERKGWPRGVNVPLTEGLWRRRVKGMRGATPKPGSMTEYIREKNLLPAHVIDAIREATPSKPLLNGEIAGWDDWLNQIIEPHRNATLAAVRHCGKVSCEVESKTGAVPADHGSAAGSETIQAVEHGADRPDRQSA